MKAKLKIVKRGPGRPPLDNPRKSMTIRMDPWVRGQMELVRKKDGIDITTQIESAVREWLSTRPTRRVKARRAS